MQDGLEELVGAWELRSCTRTMPDGSTDHQYGDNPRGVILYTPDGWMSCHMACGADDVGDARFTQYTGYHGPIVMRPADRVVEHHVRHATLDWMLGTVQERAYDIRGDMLHLSAKVGDNLVEVVWSRGRAGR